MDASSALSNVLNPPVLFFALGMAATLLRSDLRLPEALQQTLSLYLMWAIGYKGGVELQHGGFSSDVLATLVAALVFSAVTPIACFIVLRRKLGVQDAAAISACYGSVSAVTFITASGFLTTAGIPSGGHMVAALALMESPAIVTGVILSRLHDRRAPYTPSDPPRAPAPSWKLVAHEACLNGPVFLLLGSLAIGWATASKAAALEPLTHTAFPGVLAFFLLDMGMVAGQRLRDLRRSAWFLVGFAVIAPVCLASTGVLIAKALGMGVGDALLFAVLCGSASYIAAPAAMRIAVPRANPSLYLPLALAVTFPFNITIGIPLYLAMIRWLL